MTHNALQAIVDAIYDEIINGDGEEFNLNDVKPLEIFPDLEIGTQSALVTNRFSGNKILLNPEELAMYDLLKGAEIVGDMKRFHICRYWFMDNNYEAYRTLID